MQNKAIEATGEVYLNDKLDSTKLRVYISSQNFYINCLGESKSQLSLYVFSSHMLNALNFEHLKNPIEYDIKGTCIGYFSQNFGHGSEPDFYGRVIKNIFISIEYSKDCVFFLLKGLAELHKNSGINPKSFPPGHWDFLIKFKIAAADISTLYGLTSEQENRYMKAMEALF